MNFIYSFYILYPRVYYELTSDQLPVGLIAQLVRALHQCIAEVMGSNPVQAWIFYRFYFLNCLSWVHKTRMIYRLFKTYAFVKLLFILQHLASISPALPNLCLLLV